jgi:glutamine phosphoribosylpyrophosphate amidotransferase
MLDGFTRSVVFVRHLWASEAANLAYLALYALQHRGQESAGIAASDGVHLECFRDMGHVMADIFTPRVIAFHARRYAIGHTRYSTAGDTVLLNAQPFAVNCNKGQIAVAHNGNITNAAELRAKLEREGSIFQASSDTRGDPAPDGTFQGTYAGGRAARGAAELERARFHWCCSLRIA